MSDGGLTSYGTLSLTVVAVALLVALVCAATARLGARWWLRVAVVAAVLTVLTIVFDSVMIIADLFRYDESTLSGVRLWLAPVEDVAWPVAAALVLPALWEVLGRRRSSGSAGDVAVRERGAR